MDINPLEVLQGEPLEELQHSFDSMYLISGGGEVGLTQYIFWMIISMAGLPRSSSFLPANV